MSQIITPPNSSAAFTGLPGVVDVIAGLDPTSVGALFLGEDAVIGATYGATLADLTANNRDATLGAGPGPERTTQGLEAADADGFSYALPAGYWPLNFTVIVVGRNVSSAVVPSFAFCGMRLCANWTGATLQVGVFGGAGNVFRSVTHPSLAKDTPFAMAVSVNGTSKLLRIRTSFGKYEVVNADIVDTIALYRSLAIPWNVGCGTESGSVSGNVLGMAAFIDDDLTFDQMDVRLAEARRKMRRERGWTVA